MNRTIKHTNSSCRVELFHYTTTDLIEEIESDSGATHNALMNVKRETIVDSLREVSINKDIGVVRSTFDILLYPTYNWKKKIRPGDWLVIYMGIDGNEEPRLLGNVDRVSRIVQVDISGTKTVRYKVSGSNFGKVFEKYNIWWNTYVPEGIAFEAFLRIEALRLRGTPNELITSILDIFLGEGTEQYNQLLQWFIPNELTEIFTAPNGASYLGAKFHDILWQNLRLTEGYRVWDNVYSLMGPLWELMQRSANSPINELFIELMKDDSGNYRPTLNLRMRPFTRRNYNVDKVIDNAQVIRFSDLTTVEITNEDIINEDLGENDHARFNNFLLKSSVSQIDGRAFTEGIAIGAAPRYPRLLKGSIRRNGMLLRHDMTDFAFLASVANKRPATDLQILKAWNNLLFEWFAQEHLYETGVMTVVGNPNIKLGTRLLVTDPTGKERSRAYYIEGYNDVWSYPNMWASNLQLTRGQDADTEQPLINTENEDEYKIGISSIQDTFFKYKQKKGK